MIERDERLQRGEPVPAAVELVAGLPRRMGRSAAPLNPPDFRAMPFARPAALASELRRTLPDRPFALSSGTARSWPRRNGEQPPCSPPARRARWPIPARARPARRWAAPTSRARSRSTISTTALAAARRVEAARRSTAVRSCGSRSPPLGRVGPTLRPRAPAAELRPRGRRHSAARDARVGAPPLRRLRTTSSRCSSGRR